MTLVLHQLDEMLKLHLVCQSYSFLSLSFCLFFLWYKSFGAQTPNEAEDEKYDYKIQILSQPLSAIKTFIRLFPGPVVRALYHFDKDFILPLL